MSRFITFISIITIMVGSACNPTSSVQTGNDPIDQKVDSLLALMTIEEKVGQMNLYNGFWDATGPAPEGGDAKIKYKHLRSGMVGAMLGVKGVEHVKAIQKIAVEETRLGIPLLFGYDVIHGFKTVSPIPLAEAASWDMDAIQKSAAIAAKEASAVGINWTFAPMVDISRDARWGRVMEGAGEDPYLGSLIAEARVKGFQGNDLTSPSTIAACAKHFAGYGFVEAGKDYHTTEINSTTLYNSILPPFEAAKNAGVKTFMNSFNDLNGVPVTGSSFLQRDILKEKWKFHGFVVSDWASIAEMITWGFAKDAKQAAKIAINAGSDMDMEGRIYVNELVDLIKNDQVKADLLDDAVSRILKVKFELGLFEDPYKYCDFEREKALLGHSDHHEAALDLAKKSIVLLKNENNLLPLAKSGKKIAVIGQLADDDNSQLGSWRLGFDDHSGVSVLSGMKALQPNIKYAQGPVVFDGDIAFIREVNVNETDRTGMKEAIRLAKNSDVVVMVLGEHGFQTGEGRSRTELDLPGLQQELLEEVYKVNKNVVLVLCNGRPLAIDWANENIPAIVEAWQLGSQSGHAIAQVLFGDHNPGGKLPMTFPRNVGQVPIYYNYKNTGRPIPDGGGTVFWSHYIDSEKTPLYPFGHGLSYSTFEYGEISLNGEDYSIGDEIEVSVSVTNTGKVAGKEVVQLYIRDLYASVIRPVKELKGFENIYLEPGETQTIKFKLDDTHLGFYDAAGVYVIEPGEFQVFVGGSSNTELMGSFNLK